MPVRGRKELERARTHLLYRFRDGWGPRSAICSHKEGVNWKHYDSYSCFSYETEVPPSELVENWAKESRTEARPMEQYLQSQ